MFTSAELARKAQRRVESPLLLSTYSSRRGIAHTTQNRGDVHDTSSLRWRSRPNPKAFHQHACHRERCQRHQEDSEDIPHLQIRLLLQHLRDLRPLTQPHAPQIDPLHPIPRRHGQLVAPRSRRARHPGIVDAVVDRAEGLDAVVDHALDIRLDRRVGFDEDGLDLGILFLEFSFKGLQTRKVDVGQHEARHAFVGEGVDGGAADA